MFNKTGLYMGISLFIGIIFLSLYFVNVASGFLSKFFYYVGIFLTGMGVAYTLAIKILRR